MFALRVCIIVAAICLPAIGFAQGTTAPEDPGASSEAGATAGGGQPAGVDAAPSFQCATFSCYEAEPFCVFTTLGQGGRQSTFRVPKQSKVCFCELMAGDRFCVTSNGQAPGRGCQQQEVRGLRPAC
jgi:hypothetical protein